MVLLTKLNDLFNKFVKVDGDQVFIGVCQFKSFLSFLEINYVDVISEAANQSGDIAHEEVQLELNWVFNKLLFIAIHDRTRELSGQIKELIRKLLIKGKDVSRTWFHDVFRFQLELLKNSLQFKDASKTYEINSLGHDSQQNSASAKIIIKRSYQLQHMIDFCLKNLRNSIEILPVIANSVEETDVRSIFSIFDSNGLSCRNKCVIFFATYSQYIPEEKFMSLCIELLYNIANTYRDMHDRLLTDDLRVEYVVYRFDVSFHEFIRVLRRRVINNRIDYSQRRLVKLLVDSIVRVIYFELKFMDECSLPSSASFFTDLVDDILYPMDFNDYDLGQVEMLQKQSFLHWEVLPLFKFKIVLEIEQAERYSLKVTETSKTWKDFHETFLENVTMIRNQDYEFIDRISWLSGAMQLTHDVHFLLTIRHQRHHLANDFCRYCNNPESQLLATENPHMKFQSWTYQHIPLHFFDDLPVLMEQLIENLAKKTWNSEFAQKLMNIFKLALETKPLNLSDKSKLYMLAVLILPFYQSFERNERLTKSTEYKKLQSMWNDEMKKFITGLADEKLTELKVESMNKLSQLRFNKINTTSMWLGSNFMRMILTGESLIIQRQFLTFFKNLLVTNMEIALAFLNLYQTLRLNKLNELEWSELEPILCLLDKDSTIYKSKSSTYEVHCKRCIQPSTSDSLTRSIIISKDSFDSKALKINISPSLLKDRSDEFYENLIGIFPACIRHADQFMEILRENNGEDIIEIILHERRLKATNNNLKNIIVSIRESDLRQEDKMGFFNRFFAKLLDLTLNYSSSHGEANTQFTIVEIIETFCSNALVDMPNGSSVIPELERFAFKCLKLMTYYMILDESEVKGLAVNCAERMLQRNGFIFHKFINWYKKSYLEHVCTLCLIACSESDTFFMTLEKFLKRTYFSNPIEFITTNINIIFTAILPHCINNDLYHHAAELLTRCNLSFSDMMEVSCLNLYECCYSMEKDKRKHLLEFIANQTSRTFSEIFQTRKMSVIQGLCADYSAKPQFTLYAVRMLENENLDLSDVDKISDFIAQNFLGILCHFERVLASDSEEKVLKQRIILSIGELIRLLGQRISNLYFKIMSILKEIAKLTDINAKMICIDVWKILLHCNASSLSPLLSVIFVSLEDYLDEYPEEVTKMCLDLINNNANLLSTHISDLFFIRKTKHNDVVKGEVLNQIQSQKLTHRNEFEFNFNLLLKHLGKENTDSAIKYYCLLYLEEFIKNCRGNFNDLIHASDPSLIKLVTLLSSCSRIAYNHQLRLQTACCLGELGAVKPTHETNEKIGMDFEATIHSDQFAIKLLKIICKYYKDIIDMKNLQPLSLAVQGIFRERKVNENHYIYKQQLPDEYQELFKTLLTSRYSRPSKNTRRSVEEENQSIFWNSAQTETNWSFILTETLVRGIEEEDTREYLTNISMSMSENQEIALFVMPRVVLQYFISNKSEEFDKLIVREFSVIFDMVMNKSIYTTLNKEELNSCYVGEYDFVPIRKDSNGNSLDKITAAIIKAAKLVFEIWDYLKIYTRSRDCDARVVERITRLKSEFNLKRLAEINFKCGEYERSMIFFEKYFLQLSESERTDEMSFLIRIYAKLGQVDLVEGINNMRVSDFSISDRIFISNFTGNLEGYESLTRMKMRDSKVTQEEIECIMSCHLQLLVNENTVAICDALLTKLYESNAEQNYCDEMKIEPLWRLCKWDDLESLLASERLQVNKNSNWNVTCGKLLVKFKQSADEESFWEELNNARLAVIDNFKIFDTDQAMYNHNYKDVVHLHMLSEVQKIYEAFKKIDSTRTLHVAIVVLDNLTREFDVRREFLQASLNIIEPTLILRRTLLSIVGKKLQIIFSDPNDKAKISQEIEKEIGKTWLESARIACKQKLFTQANEFLIKAEMYQMDEHFIEKAKYYRKRNNFIKAINILQSNCEQLSNIRNKSPQQLRLLSRAKLKFAQYNANEHYVEIEVIVRLFKEAIIPGAENEKVYLSLGDCMDRHYFAISENDNTNDLEMPDFKILLEIMSAYFESMKYGSDYVLQSMSRFLQIWLDASSLCKNKTAKAKYKTRENIGYMIQMTELVEKTLEVIPIERFYPAFSQLISRLTHPSTSVFKVIKMIMIKLINKYPMQSMWFVVPGLKSKSLTRRKRTSEIFQSSTRITTQFTDFNTVIDRLMAFTQSSKSNGDKAFFDKMCPEINEIFKRTNILMPLQLNLAQTEASGYNSVVNNQVLIHRIEEKFETMSSLQKPKKITFIGNDGKRYAMLLKYRDDLRIDFRFLEFVKVLNDFFKKHSDASQRSLAARRYSVIPLNEELGIIEWVPNLNTMKNVLYEQYANLGIKVPAMPEVKKFFLQWTKAENKIENFHAMKKVYPPSLGSWFLYRFSTPRSYFSARQNFIKSVAVMSMIGYIMGLGDRHLENILIDLFSGEAVHVDFNCLFHKGESLQVPETVPFRLTQSMIEAMGVLGCEGPFTKCCQITMRVMQSEKNTLMSYLRPFIYDPMISGNDSENFDSRALENLRCIKNKLHGDVRRFKEFSRCKLTLNGQVKTLIDEATSDKNLSVMYYHWNPFI